MAKQVNLFKVRIIVNDHKNWKMKINVIYPPKGPFVPLGDNLGPGRFLRSQFVLKFFGIFWSCAVLQELCKYVIFISINAWQQKLWQNKQKWRFVGSIKKITKSQNKFFWNFYHQRLYFCLHMKLWFILFGLVMRKLWTI